MQAPHIRPMQRPTLGAMALLTVPLTVLLSACGGGSGVGGGSEAGLYVTQRVSLTTLTGQPANSHSDSPALSKDGRFVAFVSLGDNLNPGDTNQRDDIFRRDRFDGTTQAVSVDNLGVYGDQNSAAPVISDDGRFIAFSSRASNLVANDTNLRSDVFLRDVFLGRTTRVSVDDNGTQASGNSDQPAISANGLFIAFTSSAADLVAGDTNRATDVFLRALRDGTTRRISVAPSGQQANGASSEPAISADGRFVTFTSSASNLGTADTNQFSDVYRVDTTTGEVVLVSINGDVQGDGGSSQPAISADGNVVAFTSLADRFMQSGTGGNANVFARNLTTGEGWRLSASPQPNGTPPVALALGVFPAVIGDGVTPAALRTVNGRSTTPQLSADGRFAVFTSRAGNLTPGDTNNADDVFVADMVAHDITRISTGLTGGGGAGIDPAISSDGQSVAFASAANALVAGDDNNLSDVFVSDRR